MRKKISLIFLILILTILISSCAGNTGAIQIDEFGIVTAMAIDIEGEDIIVTSQIVSQTSNMNKGDMGHLDNKPTFIQSNGKTVFDALQNATLIYDGELFLSHNSLLVFSEELAKRGIGDIINFFAYDIGIRETANMLVAKGSKGYEVFGLPEISDDYIQKIIKNIGLTAKTRSITLTEYFRYYFDQGTPILGVVEKKEKMEIDQEKKKESPTKAVLNFEGGAPFFKDKLVGYYSPDEMIGFNFIVNEIQDNLIVFKTPQYLDEESKFYSTEGKYTTVEIIKSKTKLDMELIDGKIHLNIDINMRGSLAEETRGLNVAHIAVKEGIEKACSAQIEDYVKMAMEKAQNEFKLDTFSIDAAFHRQHPQIWREIHQDWHEIFSGIEYSVNAKTSIVKAGLMDIPTNIRRGVK